MTILKRPEPEAMLAEILEVITSMQKNFPERYYLLGEMPVSFSYDEKEIKAAEYEQYLGSVRVQLASCIETAA